MWNISRLVSKFCCGRPRGGYVASNEGMDQYLAPEGIIPLWFSLRTFFSADLSVAGIVVLVNLQALGTMVEIYIPAPHAVQAGLLRGAGRLLQRTAEDFSEDLADGRGVAFSVAATT